MQIYCIHLNCINLGYFIIIKCIYYFSILSIIYFYTKESNISNLYIMSAKFNLTIAIDHRSKSKYGLKILNLLCDGIMLEDTKIYLGD